MIAFVILNTLRRRGRIHIPTGDALRRMAKSDSVRSLNSLGHEKVPGGFLPVIELDGKLADVKEEAY